MVSEVSAGCVPVAQVPHIFESGHAPSDTQGMEPLAAISLATTRGSRPAGWQAQVRIDYAINKVAQTHRGQSEDQVAQAIHDQLRALGVVPNGRQVAQYATAISALPQLPPNNK
ncbi:hypothetical protein GCM10010172_68130 [Paractinoplanes ferrugineus]|uniref:Uncharacterized protein n=1 Tax=Paractinoplanes ferrugineus TaxID=113564 RepID=A0A919MDX0_9ACTN|nr:hypothetical protein Afe05nite_40230 [Actinoplanes ferrugineus]